MPDLLGEMAIAATFIVFLAFFGEWLFVAFELIDLWWRDRQRKED